MVSIKNKVKNTHREVLNGDHDSAAMNGDHNSAAGNGAHNFVVVNHSFFSNHHTNVTCMADTFFNPDETLLVPDMEQVVGW